MEDDEAAGRVGERGLEREACCGVYSLVVNKLHALLI